MTKIHNDNVYTAAEVAKLLGRSGNTVRRKAAQLGKPNARFFSGAEVKQIMGVTK